MTQKNMKNHIDGLKALVFDMDGVVTQTAKIHKAAWKEMFNSFLEKEHNPSRLMNDEDYIKYIDGKPRYAGVESFLKSRSIELPFGNEDDPPGEKTVCGLGNEKNRIYRQLLKVKGAEVYPDAVEKIKKWRKTGLKTAIVSSSKNCKLVLETAGITNLFDVRVDGEVAQKHHLKGKPNPDIFLKATKELGVTPSSCIVFEDAISGVQAGSNGNFALVVGVLRTGAKSSLSENGADMVIENFSEFHLFHDEEIRNYFVHAQKKPAKELKISELIKGKSPVLFFDYDGTLAPIVKRPEDALISDEMKNLLKQCAEKFTVAVISGRDMDDLKDKVKLDEIIYAGSHGFRISGPDGLYMEHENSEQILPRLSQMENKLKRLFLSVDRQVQVERKRFAIAVHYRNANEENIPLIEKNVTEVKNEYAGFKLGAGKKILEIKPDVGWHKGKAVAWILKKLNRDDTGKFVPLYIGDDVTDEDAFKEIKDYGIGILVGAHGEETHAKYRLKNVYQVKIFLKEILAQKTEIAR